MRLCSCLAALVFAIACTPPASRAPAGPANLVLVSIDTLRADHVGAYGYALPTTPHIDALAADGLRFEQSVAHAPTTLASHASILTSLLPRHHGASIARKSRLADQATPLAEVLGAHGYRTASFNGGIQLDAAYGLDRGFDVYESAKPDGALPETLAGPEDRLANGVDRAAAWLAEGGEPFFVFLHSYEIHHPYTPDRERLALFDADYDGPLPDRISVELLQRINRGEQPVTAADRAHIVHAYDAELHSADAAFGRLVEELRTRGLYDDTLIVLTSDHGEEFGEHGQMGWHAHTLYEELLRVPLVMKLPESRSKGVVHPALARGVDVAPTVLSALGIAAPASYHGRDLLAEGEGQGGSTAALSMHDVDREVPLFTLRAGDWKLKRVGAESLFHLPSDPLEEANVVGREQDRARGLRRQAFSLLEARATPEDVPAPLDAGTEERLRALGYVE